MQIDWLAFSPGPAFFGGILLGVAAALYVILHGRILGIEEEKIVRDSNKELKRYLGM